MWGPTDKNFAAKKHGPRAKGQLCRNELIKQPETARLTKACLQGCPLAGDWELGLEEASPHLLNDEWLPVPKLCANQVLLLDICFPSGNLEFGVC